MRLGGENMINVRKLKAKIVENGKTITEMSQVLGINPSTFYRKLKQNSFEIGEADVIVRELKLSIEEANAIFFSQIVA